MFKKTTDFSSFSEEEEKSLAAFFRHFEGVFIEMGFLRIYEEEEGLSPRPPPKKWKRI